MKSSAARYSCTNNSFSSSSKIPGNIQADRKTAFLTSCKDECLKNIKPDWYSHFLTLWLIIGKLVFTNDIRRSPVLLAIKQKNKICTADSEVYDI